MVPHSTAHEAADFWSAPTCRRFQEAKNYQPQPPTQRASNKTRVPRCSFSSGTTFREAVSQLGAPILWRAWEGH